MSKCQDSNKLNSFKYYIIYEYKNNQSVGQHYHQTSLSKWQGL